MFWLLDHEKRELRQLELTLETLANKNKELEDDDDWIVGQSKLADQERKVYEINLIIKLMENFKNNIEEIKKVQSFKIIYIA